jgi:hypothetical protein
MRHHSVCHVPLPCPKQGFDPLLAEWLRGPLLTDPLAPDTLRRQGIFEAPAVEQLVQEHQCLRDNHDYALWTLLAFQLWLEHPVEP